MKKSWPRVTEEMRRTAWDLVEGFDIVSTTSPKLRWNPEDCGRLARTERTR
jgi:hypothetical protein